MRGVVDKMQSKLFTLENPIMTSYYISLKKKPEN